MTIVNEQFIIGNITHEQHKTYFYTPPADKQSEQPMSQQVLVEAVNPAAATSSMAAGPSAAIIPGLTEQQTLMLQEFSAQSRLNHEWSK